MVLERYVIRVINSHDFKKRCWSAYKYNINPPNAPNIYCITILFDANNNLDECYTKNGEFRLSIELN